GGSAAGSGEGPATSPGAAASARPAHRPTRAVPRSPSGGSPRASLSPGPRRCQAAAPGALTARASHCTIFGDGTPPALGPAILDGRRRARNWGLGVRPFGPAPVRAPYPLCLDASGDERGGTPARTAGPAEDARPDSATSTRRNITMDEGTFMTQSENATAEPPKADSADTAWAESLREVMCKVISTLPDHATLGELIDAAKSNAAMA